MVTETDLALGDGRTLHVYDTGTGDGTTGLTVFWHHGAPSTGAPPEPLFAAAAETDAQRYANIQALGFAVTITKDT